MTNRTFISHLLITLPKNRAEVGTLEVINIAGHRVFTCDARGKADNAKAKSENNPDRDPTKPWGDTPTGAWASCRVTRFKGRTTLGMGWIKLPAAHAVSGDAVQAKINGRTGLGIHAGRGNGSLMATYGCVRVFDRDWTALEALLDGSEFDVVIVEEGQEIVTVPSQPDQFEAA